MLPLTIRQREAMIEICNFIDGYKYPPSVRELSELMGNSSAATTHQVLVILEKKGYIRREKSKPRALKVICRI